MPKNEQGSSELIVYKVEDDDELKVVTVGETFIQRWKQKKMSGRASTDPQQRSLLM